MNSSNHRLAIVLVVLSIITPPALALDVTLTYTRHPDVQETAHPRGSVVLPDGHEIPPGDWTLPTLVSEKPIYQLQTLGDRQHLLVLDRQKAEDPSYNRLYFDANANHDLTDDTIVDGAVESRGASMECRFPPTDITVEIDGISYPYCVSLRTYRHKPGLLLKLLGALAGEGMDFFYGRVALECSYTGNFILGGQRYGVWLSDRNFNGRFDDPFTVQGEGKRERDFTGDGLYVRREGVQGRFESFVLGNRLYLNGTLYDVDVDITDGKMTLAPISEGLVRMKTAMAFEELQLFSADRKRTIMLHEPGESISLPPDEYRLLFYRAYRHDEQGDRWTVYGEGAVPGAASILVKSGEDGVLPYGEPFVPTMPIKGRTLWGNGVEFGFLLEGSGGEEGHVQHIVGAKTKLPLSTRERNRPKEPSYKITKADGEIVAQGTFKYG